MKYIDKFKTIYKDWWMSNLDRDYNTKTKPQHLIANSSRYLSEVFHRDNFIVNDKQQYFGNKETFKHLTPLTRNPKSQRIHDTISRGRR